MENPSNYDSDRRSAVRVKDRILFSYKHVPDEKYTQLLEDFSRGISPYKQWDSKDIQLFSGAQGALERLREHNEDLAEFLHYLDTKINLILNSLQGGLSPLEGLTLREVEISGSGISFFSTEHFSSGDFLEFSMGLLPSYTFINAFGKVIQCEKLKKLIDGAAYKTAVEFTLLMDEDREKLIHHNFKLQTLMLRQRRRR